MKAITRLGIGLVVLTMALGLPMSQPAYADVEITAQAFLDTYCGGSPTITDEVEIMDDTSGTIATDCTVKLGPDGELEFGKNVSIAVTDKFEIDGDGGSTGEVEVQFGEGNTVTAGDIVWKLKGEEAELQVKKNSMITTTSSDIIIEVTGGEDDGEIQLEENIQMHAGGSGKIMLKATSTSDDAEIQIKKVSDPDLLDGDFADDPNITAPGGIFMEAGSEEGEIQIEESNFLRSTTGEIKLDAKGSEESEVQTKKFVQLEADGKIILLASSGSEREVQVEESNKFTSDSSDIVIDSGSAGETEVKNSGTYLTASSGTVTVAGGGECEVEAGVTITTPKTICGVFTP